MCLNLLNTRITIANFHFNYKMNLENITIKTKHGTKIVPCIVNARFNLFIQLFKISSN